MLHISDFFVLYFVLHTLVLQRVSVALGFFFAAYACLNPKMVVICSSWGSSMTSLWAEWVRNWGLWFDSWKGKKFYFTPSHCSQTICRVLLWWPGIFTCVQGMNLTTHRCLLLKLMSGGVLLLSTVSSWHAERQLCFIFSLCALMRGKDVKSKWKHVNLTFIFLL